jgi:acyl transferase domain-containing protein
MNDAVYVVGMACRFPGARDLHGYYENLKSGICSIRGVDGWRKSVFDPYGSISQSKLYLFHGGFLCDVDLFDSAFFQISPPEAQVMDPQQRILLQTVWHLLENARLTPSDLKKGAVGVYVGGASNDYGSLLLRDGERPLERRWAAGNAMSILANRISYYYDFYGPSIAIDTACSSSLSCLHYALMDLKGGNCSAAVVAGVNLILDSTITSSFDSQGMMSPQGQCFTFDARANGYVRGEGCGCILLVTQEFLDRFKLHPLAKVCSTAMIQDGRTNGLNAPSMIAQAKTIAAAYQKAGIDSSEVDYVELHGTGTALGDPIEAKALGLNGSERDILRVGSVKTNIGHLEAAAGIAGVIKSVLMLYHQELYPSLNFQSYNPRIKAEEWKLSLVQTYQKRELSYAGVSSFGFGGTNVHALLSHVSLPSSVQRHGTHRTYIPIWGKSEWSVNALVDSVDSSCTAEGLSQAMQFRERGSWHGGVYLKSDGGLQKVQAKNAQVGKAGKFALLFSGQGSQLKGLPQLLSNDPLVGKYYSILKKELDEEHIQVADTEAVHDTKWAQALICLYQACVSQALFEEGFSGSLFLGHSVGEYSCFAAGGGISWRDLVRLMVKRGRIMAEMNGGAMLYVGRGWKELQSLGVFGVYDIELCSDNGDACVIGGSVDSILQIKGRLKTASVVAREVNVRKAFHTRDIEKVKSGLDSLFPSGLTLPEDSLVLSNLSGEFHPRNIGSNYAFSHARNPVKFSKCLKALAGSGVDVVVEIGPKPLFGSLVRKFCKDLVYLPIGVEQVKNGWGEIFASLFCAGLSASSLEFSSRGWSLGLPSYPFIEESYWYSKQNEVPMAPGHDSSGGTVEAQLESFLRLAESQLRGD